MSRLIPSELREKMIENARNMLKGREDDHPPVVKLFSIAGNATWLLSELNPMEPTVAFGLCDLGMGSPELGYVSLEELESIQHPSLPIPLIVRDEHFEADYLMSVYAEAARRRRGITEDPVNLQQAHQKLLTQTNKSKYVPS
ncbi:MAG: DUF2958 domain-containing protein [Spirosomataceae bacterium]